MGWDEAVAPPGFREEPRARFGPGARARRRPTGVTRGLALLRPAPRWLRDVVVYVSLLTVVSRTLYLRGVPEALWREAKVLAAQRGTTLTSVVIDALQKEVGESALATVPAELRTDMEWYDANKKRLLRRHRGQYLAISDARVVDHDADFGALAQRVFEQLGRRPVFMPLCEDGEREVRLPSPSRAAS